MKFYRPDTFNTVNKQSENAIYGKNIPRYNKTKIHCYFLN